MEFSRYAEVNPKCGKVPEAFYYIDLECVNAGEINDLRIEMANTAPSRAQRVLTLYDILFQTVRPYQKNNYHFKAENDLPTVASTGYAVFRTEQCSEYLYELIHTERFLSDIMKRCTGTSFPAVSSSDIEDITVWIPDIQEQTKIGDFLSLINARITKQRTLIERLKKYKRGVIEAIFSREVQFDNCSNWERRLFSEIATLNKEKYSPKKKEAFPCVELEHIEQQTGQIIGYANSADQNSVKSTFHKGDVLFGKLRPYLRKYANPDFDGVCSSEIWVFHPVDGIDSSFLFYLIQSETFIATANISSGTKMPRAEWSNVSKTSFFIPNILEQKRIADLLISLDKRIVNASETSNNLQTLKRGLLQQLFI